MLGDERADLVGHVEELCPLFLVERDRKTAQPIDGHAALLAHLQRNAFRGAFFQRLVFLSESFELGAKIFIAHSSSPDRVPRKLDTARLAALACPDDRSQTAARIGRRPVSALRS